MATNKLIWGVSKNDLESYIDCNYDWLFADDWYDNWKGEGEKPKLTDREVDEIVSELVDRASGETLGRAIDNFINCMVLDTVYEAIDEWVMDQARRIGFRREGR